MNPACQLNDIKWYKWYKNNVISGSSLTWCMLLYCLKRIHPKHRVSRSTENVFATWRRGRTVVFGCATTNSSVVYSPSIICSERRFIGFCTFRCWIFVIKTLKKFRSKNSFPGFNPRKNQFSREGNVSVSNSKVLV